MKWTILTTVASVDAVECWGVFETREEAVEYIRNNIYGTGVAVVIPIHEA